jgi:hypothetical protein
MGLFYLIHPNSGAFVKSPFIQFSPLLGGGKDSGPSLDGQEDAFGDTKDAVNVGVDLLGPSIAPDALEADPNGEGLSSAWPWHVEGRPICCEMWPGNTADVKTLLPIVKRMRERFSLPLALRIQS